MRHQVSGRKLNMDTNHRKMLIRTQVRQLLEHGFLKTTETKSKVIKVEAEKIINKAKTPNLNLIRKISAELGGRDNAKKILELAKNAGTNGIVKSVRLGRRIGDNTMVVRLELIPKVKIETEEKTETKKESKESKKETKKQAKKIEK